MKKVISGVAVLRPFLGNACRARAYVSMYVVIQHRRIKSTKAGVDAAVLAALVAEWHYTGKRGIASSSS